MSDDLSVPSTTNAVSGAVELNPTVTLALAQASVAAYSDFARVPYTIPRNYKVFARFTGWDPYWGGPERFGLIFQSTGPHIPANQFIVAFRGTDSLTDVLDDTMWNQVDFQPFRNSVSPTPNVHRGFYEIYSTPIQGCAAYHDSIDARTDLQLVACESIPGAHYRPQPRCGDIAAFHTRHASEFAKREYRNAQFCESPGGRVQLAGCL